MQYKVARMELPTATVDLATYVALQRNSECDCDRLRHMIDCLFVKADTDCDICHNISQFINPSQFKMGFFFE